MPKYEILVLFDAKVVTPSAEQKQAACVISFAKRSRHARILENTSENYGPQMYSACEQAIVKCCRYATLDARSSTDDELQRNRLVIFRANTTSTCRAEFMCILRVHDDLTLVKTNVVAIKINFELFSRRIYRIQFFKIQ